VFGGRSTPRPGRPSHVRAATTAVILPRRFELVAGLQLFHRALEFFKLA
jgi:hypothetical protein